MALNDLKSQMNNGKHNNKSRLEHLSGVAARGFGDLGASQHASDLFDTAAAIESINADFGPASDRFLAHEKM